MNIWLCGKRFHLTPESHAYAGLASVRTHTAFTTTGGRLRFALLFIPDPPSCADMRQQTFRRRKKILHLARRTVGIMRQVEDRDLETDFGAILSFW